MNHNIFVYGALKKGFQKHHLIEQATFIGTGQTAEKYALYADNLPVVVKGAEVSFIKGEVYFVDDFSLSNIDSHEWVHASYLREKVDVVLNIDFQLLPAWMYFSHDPEGQLIESGMYQEEMSITN